MGIRISWSDINDAEQGHKVYKSSSPMTLGNLPTPIADLGADITHYDDGDVIEGNTYYYRVSAYIGAAEAVSSELVVIAEESAIPRDGLYAEFLFNSFSGTNVVNNASGGDGTLLGGAVIDTANTLSGHNTLDLGTTNDTNLRGLEIQNSADFDITQPHTISLWFYRDVLWQPSNHRYTALVTKGSVFTNGLSFHVYERSASNEVLIQGNYGGDSSTDTSKYALGWHHLLLENDPANNEANLYIDNVFIASTVNIPSSVIDLNAPIRLGDDDDSARTWRRYLALFRIYTRVLTAQEKTSLYEEVTL